MIDVAVLPRPKKRQRALAWRAALAGQFLYGVVPI